ncbi:hypothetical protein JTL44_35035, partial [Pseudomonas aeruginosa]|nr:hypothetical protein [Pseudomonas aeruginosa]
IPEVFFKKMSRSALLYWDRVKQSRHCSKIFSNFPRVKQSVKIPHSHTCTTNAGDAKKDENH